MAGESMTTNPVMREAIAAYDWGSTVIGSPDTWPQSLRAVLALVLLTAFRQGDGVVVEVADFGGWKPRALQQAQRGYGLPLVRAFSDGVEIERGAEDTRVRLVTVPDADSAAPAPSETALR